MGRCPVCELKTSNCDCSAEAKELHCLREELEGTKPRKLTEVIKQMLDKIPKEESVFVFKLCCILKSVVYSSPESLGAWWDETGAIVSSCVREPTAIEVGTWEVDVVRIWIDNAEWLPEGK